MKQPENLLSWFKWECNIKIWSYVCVFIMKSNRKALRTKLSTIITKRFFESVTNLWVKCINENIVNVFVNPKVLFVNSKVCESKNFVCESKKFVCKLKSFFWEFKKVFCESQKLVCEFKSFVCEFQNFVCESKSFVCKFKKFCSDWFDINFTCNKTFSAASTVLLSNEFSLVTY